LLVRNIRNRFQGIQVPQQGSIIFSTREQEGIIVRAPRRSQ
jgi:hypothetical protein